MEVYQMAIRLSDITVVFSGRLKCLIWVYWLSSFSMTSKLTIPFDVLTITKVDVQDVLIFDVARLLMFILQQIHWAETRDVI